MDRYYIRHLGRFLTVLSPLTGSCTSTTYPYIPSSTLFQAEIVTWRSDEPSVCPTFFYIQTLKRPCSIADTPYPKKTHRLLTILSQEEVAQLIDAARHSGTNLARIVDRA
jgi:hypothetical protein